MRILRAIVGVQSLLMRTREANVAKRRSEGSQYAGDDNRRIALTPKKWPEQPHRRGFVALGPAQELENLAFAVDSPPHVHLPSSDLDHRFIEVPTTLGFRPGFTQVLGNDWPESENPPTDRLIADR